MVYSGSKPRLLSKNPEDLISNASSWKSALPPQKSLWLLRTPAPPSFNVPGMLVPPPNTATSVPTSGGDPKAGCQPGQGV